MLKAYSGSRPREHFGSGGAPHVSATYGTDQTGTKSYEFNSLGYRGEEHDPLAVATIFVCGCSNTFGIGLNLDELWVHHFKVAYAEWHGLNPAAVNVLNFSEGGASNDYITRTLLTQCAEVRPALVIAQFAQMYRSEAFLDGKPYTIGPWYSPDVSTWRRVLSVPWRSKRTVLRRLVQAGGHLRRYSSEAGFADTMRNMLLLQFYCCAKGIRCVLTWSERRRLDDAAFRNNAVLKPLIALLDPACFCDFAMRDPDIRVDAAADDKHPGPESHALFGARLFEFYQRTMVRSS